MSEEKDKNEYFKKWQNVKLSDSARTRIKKNLAEYAHFHAASVRAEEESRLKERVSRTPLFRRFNFKTMPVFIVAAVILLGGGTSLAAQGSIPGDLLYPVKVGFNESIRGALALSADAEARLQAELLEERLEEAEALQSEGRLEGELAADLEHRIERHALAAESTGEASVALRSNSRVRVALDRFNALLHGGSLAINDDAQVSMEAYDTRAEGDFEMGMSTMLAQEEIPLERIREMTQKNIENLRALTLRHKAQLRADLYAEFDARLKNATDLMVRSKTQAEAEARQTIFAAADIAGEIEARLSELGTVEIDPETGMILEIDFSKPPIQNRGGLDIGEEVPAYPGDFGGGTDGNAGVEVDISDDMIELRGGAGINAEAPVRLDI